jgi:molybdopterin molybdotransferase
VISVDDARLHLLNAAASIAIERVSLFDALGQTLAADVLSPVSLPPFDVSSVDGYAVRATDIASATSATPVSLVITGQSSPGVVSEAQVRPGSAIRIMTGAPVPPGATAIVSFENTDELDREGHNDVIRILFAGKIGENLRCAASVVQAETVALRRGTLLTPARLGTLSSLGLTTVDVHRRPRIALVSVGNRYAALGAALGAAQIFEANEVALAAAVQEAGGRPVPLGIVADHLGAIANRLTRARDADLIVLSGGVAHGSSDVVKDFLVARGRVVFWRVAMRPGRPCEFGWIGEQPVLTLAGNPGAALVGFEQFVRPFIRKLLGRDNVLRPEIDVVVRGQAQNPDGRRCFLPARVAASDGALIATLATRRGPADAVLTAEPNALVVVPGDCAEVRDGDHLPAQILTWNDEDAG